MTQAAVLTTGLAIAFAAVLAFVLVSGRLPVTKRGRLEAVLRAFALAIFVPFYGWSLISRAYDGDWLWVAFQPVLWIFVTVTVVRERRRKARAKARQPGTFA